MVAGMSDPQTALVVFRSADELPTAASATAFAPDPATVASVQSYFQSLGFDVHPAVGVSFAIEGDPSVFESAFGSAAGAFDLDRLPEDVREAVGAVTVTEPPDFGPTNP
jgi:hypothetical protein